MRWWCMPGRTRAGPGTSALHHRTWHACSVAWGIIARSAGLFQNAKKARRLHANGGDVQQVCVCDGRTLWDENDMALKRRKEAHVPSA